MICKWKLSPKHLLAAVGVASVLSGCQTVVTPPSRATVVPENRTYARLAVSSPNPANVIVVRDSGFLGSGVDKRFYVNDELIAQLAPGEKLEFRLDPGEYIFSTHSGPASTILANAPVYLDQHIEAGKFYYYRLYSDMNKPGQLGRVTPKALGIE